MNRPPSPLAHSSAPKPLSERKVGVGELDVVRGEFLLRTLLGSCIGLTLYDESNQIGGLAHVVLPNSGGQRTAPGKYADTAVHGLLDQIEKMGGSRRRLSAKIAGGANMFGSSRPGAIGERNIAAVEEQLRLVGIPLKGQHCGGRQGRRMSLDVATGRVTIEIVGSPLAEL